MPTARTCRAVVASPERRRAGLGWSDVRRNRRGAVQPLQPQQVATVVDDCYRDRPGVADGLDLGRRSNPFHVVER